MEILQDIFWNKTKHVKIWSMKENKALWKSHNKIIKLLNIVCYLINYASYMWDSQQMNFQSLFKFKPFSFCSEFLFSINLLKIRQ